MTAHAITLLAGCACIGALASAWAEPPPNSDRPVSGVQAVGPSGDPAEAETADPLAAELQRRLKEDIQPLLRQYCFECHSGAKVKGDIRLDALTNIRDGIVMTDDLSLAKSMVSTREMPPKDKPGPTDHERLVLEQWLGAMLEYAPPDSAQDPGWFTIHRLNRAEYRNTMRDLLGIAPREVDLAAKLPRDDTGYGFDNNADVLTMSSLAVEQYLDAAERAIDLALGPEVRVSSEPRPVKPLTGLGNGEDLPRGGYILFSNGAVQGACDIPATATYAIRVRAWETHGGDDHARLSLRIDGHEEKSFPISGTREHPEEVEVRVRVSAGPHTLSAHFTNDYYEPNVADRNLSVESMSVAGPLEESTTERPLAWQEIFGTSKDGTAEQGDSPERAARILERFATRAYRRPVRPDEREALLKLLDQQRRAGSSFEAAVRVALSAILVSPNFLYRSLDNSNAGDPTAIYTLNGYELASRLSYFLWSSTPDGVLMGLAEAGTLVDEGVLREQVRRMLADPRSDAFIENFTGQWLQLRTLDSLAMDRARFPEYDDGLRTAMIAEARLFFGDVFRSDRSVLLFLDSDYSFLNDRLAGFYGVDGVAGPEFRRVAWPESSPRGGVLTMGAVLTVTSNTTRTSPVKRGLYVLDQILGSPPPPPPADVPPLEKSSSERPGATLREQLAAHVANPTCAVCHNRLDPLGLAFENFNAIGRWREQDAGQQIDATGTLPGGVTFSGARDLKKILLQRGDQFVETLSGKVLMYAIGRGLEPFDRPAVRGIAVRTRSQGDGFGALIEAVVLSNTFRTCRGRELDHE